MTLNLETVKLQLKVHYGELMQMICGELGKKLFSLKYDTATRRYRSLLGVSAQFMDKSWNVVVRHLGMIELEGSHTASLIKSNIEKLLRVM